MTQKRIRVAVVGIGYTGLSNAVLLAQRNQVTALDVMEERVEALNQRRAPVADPLAQQFLSRGELFLTATTDPIEAYRGADYIIICVPTDLKADASGLDTGIAEQVIGEAVAVCPEAVVVIRSTVPVGFTAAMTEKYPGSVILFCPEFCREGTALADEMNPDRIVIGAAKNEMATAAAKRFAELLTAGMSAKPTVRFTGPTEAEAVKLFANAYLALRVSFFNELDSFAEQRDIHAAEIIEDMGLDPRIGGLYNRPSFGYGGYCLPKDTAELCAAMGEVSGVLIRSIGAANEARIKYIADQAIREARERSGKTQPVVGLYRLTMKPGSDNFREAASVRIAELLLNEGADVIAYEPLLDAADDYRGIRIENDFEAFCARADLIVADRYSPQLEEVRDKVYTRDPADGMSASRHDM